MNYKKQKRIKAAVDMLTQGYEEEMNLYAMVRDLSLKEKNLLKQQKGTTALYHLMEKKEEVLELIGRIEAEMDGAKTLVMAQEPEKCPHLWHLAALLDSVQDMIEDIRDVERDNALMFDRVSA